MVPDNMDILVISPQTNLTSRLFIYLVYLELNPDLREGCIRCVLGNSHTMERVDGGDIRCLIPSPVSCMSEVSFSYSLLFNRDTVTHACANDCDRSSFSFLIVCHHLAALHSSSSQPPTRNQYFFRNHSCGSQLRISQDVQAHIPMLFS